VADRQRTVSILIEAKNAASNALGKVGLSLNGLAIAAAAAGAALTAIIAVMAKATAAAAEQEKADVRLATALASIGQNTAETRADLAGFIDSAAATGQDATSAAEQLANVIVKGQGRLKGINTLFEEGTSKAARYAAVLQEVEDKTRGTAEAHGKTFEGALSQVSIEMERLLELLGKSVVENVAVRDAIAQLAATIKAAAGFIREHRQEFDALVTVIGKVAEAALVAVPKMLQFSAMVVQFIPGGQALTSILRLMKMALKEVETETIDTAAGIRNVGAGASETGKAMKNAFDRLKFDIDLLSDLREQAADVVEVWQIAQGLFASGEINSSQLADARDRLREIVLELQKLGVFVPEFGIVLDEVARDTMDLSEAIGERAVGAAEDLGAALVDAAFGAKFAFKDFVRSVLADLARVAISSGIQLLLKLARIWGGGGATAAVDASTFDPFTGGFQHGGEVRGGIPGIDSVLAALTPGEIVLPRSRAEDFDDVADFASRVRRGDGGGAAAAGQGISLNLTVNVLEKGRLVTDLMEAFNEAVERRGYRLISSEVLP
jgi:hypothetical protein